MYKEYNNWSIEKGDYNRTYEEQEGLYSKIIKDLAKHYKFFAFIIMLIIITYIVL